MSRVEFLLQEDVVVAYLDYVGDLVGCEDPLRLDPGRGDSATKLALAFLVVVDLEVFGQRADDHRDFHPEALTQRPETQPGVLEDVVEQARGDQLLVHPVLGEQLGHRQRVLDKRDLVTNVADRSLV